MAFTRAFLKGLGIDDDKVGAIMEAHVEVTDALKAQRDGFKVDAEKYEAVKAELDSVKADDWKAKHDALKGDFDAYRAEVAETAMKEKRAGVYRDALKAAGVAEKHFDKIMRLADTSIVSFGDDGSIVDADGLNAKIMDEWSDYITVSGTQPAPVAEPPQTVSAVSKEQFRKMGYKQKLELFNENPELYNQLRQ